MLIFLSKTVFERMNKLAPSYSKSDQLLLNLYTANAGKMQPQERWWPEVLCGKTSLSDELINFFAHPSAVCVWPDTNFKPLFLVAVYFFISLMVQSPRTGDYWRAIWSLMDLYTCIVYNCSLTSRSLHYDKKQAIYVHTIIHLINYHLFLYEVFMTLPVVLRVFRTR